jgi:hypothetical protein
LAAARRVPQVNHGFGVNSTLPAALGRGRDRLAEAMSTR